MNAGPTTSDHLTGAVAVRDLLYGRLVSHALCAMTEFKIADQLAAGPLPVGTLAGLSAVDADALYRLLRALSAFGVVVEGPATFFALTPLGDALRTDVPATAAPTAALISAVVGPAWNELSHTLRTGKAAFPEIFSADFFGYLDGNPPLREVFDQSQEAGLALELPTILASLDLAGARHLVDVGSGDGALSAALLTANPGLRATLVDRAAPLAGARRRLSADGLAARATFLDEDFFQHAPAGADLYLLRHIMHNWDDDACVAVLTTCRGAMRPDSAIAVIEPVVPPAGDASPVTRNSAIMDLYMMSLFGTARERTADEFAVLLEKAGFSLSGITYLPTGAGIIRASVSKLSPSQGGPSDMPNYTIDNKRALAVASRWLSDFVCQPDEKVGRPGPVCPFVEPALQAGSIRFETRDGLLAATDETIKALIADMAEIFRATEWPHRNKTIHALIYILPDLPEDSWTLLDQGQRAAKPTLAEDGLMLGQFHPHCDEPAARNSAFLVARSPIPMLALRNMSLHDIMFLGQEERNFLAYDKRFGHAYEKHTGISPLFRKLYSHAKEEFS
jgi:hypothetical protein